MLYFKIRISQYRARDFLSDFKIPNICALVKLYFGFDKATDVCHKYLPVRSQDPK